MSQRQLRVAELVQREVSVALRQNWGSEASLIRLPVPEYHLTSVKFTSAMQCLVECLRKKPHEIF